MVVVVAGEEFVFQMLAEWVEHFVFLVFVVEGGRTFYHENGFQSGSCW